MSARVLNFRPRRVNCADCGAPFTPMQTWHQRCTTCWHWLCVGLAVHRSTRALAALREVGR